MIAPGELTGEPLSARERQVYEMRAAGLLLREVAAELHITVQAVGFYHRRAVAKLGISVGSKYLTTHTISMASVDGLVVDGPALPAAAVEREQSKRAFVQLTERCYHCGSRQLYKESDKWGTRYACLTCGRSSE